MNKKQTHHHGEVEEGTVVLVAGKLDERVRDASGDVIYGTVIWINGDECAVLLKDGDIWVGRYSEVFNQAEYFF